MRTIAMDCCEEFHCFEQSQIYKIQGIGQLYQLIIYLKLNYTH